MDVDQKKLEAFMGKMIGHMTGGMIGTRVSIWRPTEQCLLVEPFALDSRARNMADNPMATMFYTGSSAICTPNSLSQDVGLALGAQAGETRLRKVFEEAGFTHFRRATETPMNLILEARA